MSQRAAVDLELTIRPSGDSSVADARLADPGSQAGAVLATDVPVALDPRALLARALDPVAYGRTLTAQVFADLRLRDAWRDARRVADGADLPLRLRLRLTTTDAGIHALRWETLRDPITDVPLATDARLRLVRSLDTDDTRPITLGPKPSLSALFVVANPSDLGRYDMAKIDVEGEVGRVQAALGGIALTVIGDGDGARSRRATLSAIQDALRAQPTIFCLMCHGKHTGDDTTLWLENNEGTTAHVTGSVLTQMLSQSDRPPLLVILIACEGGGKSHHDGPLAALGPRLAHTGVGAVLAMQDTLSISAATRLLPVLFEELARDGRIDRAVALARAALREGTEWWIPTLWLRMRDGRLWAEDSPPTSGATGGIPIGGNVGTVQVITVSGGQVGSIIGSQHHYGTPPIPIPATGRTNTDAIATQRKRLDLYRATLAHYINQIAITGTANARPEVTAGIREARAGIARVKAALVTLGEPTKDELDDTE